jgi:DNA-binding NtrC family response regulator
MVVPTPGGLTASGAPLTLAELEKRHIAATLERTGWHQGRAAGELGISVKTLYRKIRAYGFQRPGARLR